MTKTLLFTLLALGAVSASGCFSRVHMSPGYGRAYRQAFERQIANPTASAKSPKGLDALEASIVVETYRTQLAPKAAPTSDQGMILLSPHSAPIGYAGPSAPAAPAAR